MSALEEAREKQVRNLAWKYMGILYPEICKGVPAWRVKDVLKDYILEQEFFDFKPVVEAGLNDPSIVVGLSVVCGELFSGASLPENMSFNMLSEYIKIFGTPFKYTRFYGGSLKIVIDNKSGKVTNSRVVERLFKDCYMADLNDLEVVVDGSFDMAGAFHGTYLPKNARISLNLKNVSMNGICNIFRGTTFSEGDSLKICVDFDTRHDLYGNSLYGLFSDCNKMDNLTIEEGSCIRIYSKNVDVVNFFTCTDAPAGFKIPVQIPEDARLYMDCSLNGKCIKKMFSFPFMNSTISGVDASEVLGIPEFSRFKDWDDFIVNHLEELKELGCEYVENSSMFGELTLPKSFNKALNTLSSCCS